MHWKSSVDDNLEKKTVANKPCIKWQSNRLLYLV